jgi:hypothetical protein
MKKNKIFRFELKVLVALSFLILLVGSCKDDTDDSGTVYTEGNLTLRLGMNAAGEAVALNEELTISDYKLNLQKVRLYISNISGIKADGTEVPFGDVALLDLDEPAGSQLVVPVGDYTGIKFGLGLDSQLNDSDPSSFANEHPLSNFQGMYWSMLKYRFAVIEGTANTVSNPTPSPSLVTYHTGTDPAYRTVQLNYDFDIQGSSGVRITELFLNIELSELLDGEGGELMPTVNTSTHSMPNQMPLTNLIMDNLQGGFFIEGAVLVD